MNSFVVEKDKLVKNIEIIKSMAIATKIIAVLKGNGYGLGLIEFAKILFENGIDFFAVSELSEAINLRREGGLGSDAEILLLSPLSDYDEAYAAIENNITLAVGSEHSRKVINSAGEALDKPAKVHIKLDTGFGRYGYIEPPMIPPEKYIIIEGAFSHFSNAFGSEKSVRKQLRKFNEMISVLENLGIALKYTHIANSCAFLRFPETHLNAVRIGSAFLGRIPIENKYGLEKIGYFKTAVSDIKILPKGFNIGYANTYTTKKPTKIAIIPVGYIHGFGIEKMRDTFRLCDTLRYIYSDLKHLCRPIKININGHQAKILGRIGMHSIVADVTKIDVKIGDEVILDVNPIFVNSEVERSYV